jgi:hypothetical protein
MTADYSQTLREIRADRVGTLANVYRHRHQAWVRDDAVAYCHRLVIRIRAIDAALCALRIVKPELSWCTDCGKRRMLAHDFCETEVCAECVGGDVEDGS